MNFQVTSHTLLTRALKDKSEDAWEQFFVRYRKYVTILLINLGTKPDDLEDLTQEIMVTLWHRLDSYDRSRSKFRTWLAAVVRFSVMNARRKSNTRKQVIYQDNQTLSEEVADKDPYMESAEIEWKNFIMETALNNLRSEFSEKTIKVFEMSLRDVSGEEISKELDLKIDSVYTLKRRVKKRLIQEVYQLQKDLNHE